jgi:hypothetical protein
LPDDVILDELGRLPVLPDEDDPAWYEDRTWRDHADVYFVLADIAAERNLHPALSLLFERASYGDPFEFMRSVVHKIEAIADPNWAILAEACIKAAKYPQRGARLLAIDELGRLRDADTLDTVIDALEDEAAKVRMAAYQSLYMICQTNDECRHRAVEALTGYLDRSQAWDEVSAAEEALENIEAI